MARQKSKNTGIMLFIGGLVILAALVWMFIGNNNKQITIADDFDSRRIIPDLDKPITGGQLKNTESPLPKAESSADPTITIEELIPKLRFYGVGEIANSWRGAEAPDFTMKDLKGNTHKLSDYRGRDVLVTFWATWCPPCHAEIPELIQLRKTVPEDKLAILAISNESLITLQTFSEKVGINYTVLQMREMPGRPYSLVRYIPSTFFIDPQGKIKLAITGAMSKELITAIINAK